MIRKPEEFRIEYKEHMRDGDGTVQLTHFITGPEELNGKGRLFAKSTLNPGCSIGYHVHEGDAELFYILKGTAEYNDAGEIRTVKRATSPSVRRAQATVLPTRLMRSWSWWR